MSKKPVAISRLADYASDPEGFVARDGAPRNEVATAHGNRAHNMAVGGRSRLRLTTVLASFFIYATTTFLLLFYFFMAAG